MKQKLPTRRMREHPDLEQLRLQAKQLFKAFKTGDSRALDEVSPHYGSAQAATFALHDAQLVIARSYGFDSWPKLKAYVDGVSVRRLVEAVRADAISKVQMMLKARPELADMTVSYGDEHRAIYYAVIYRRPEIARLLMQKSANARAGIHPHRDATSAEVSWLGSAATTDGQSSGAAAGVPSSAATPSLLDLHSNHRFAAGPSTDQPAPGELSVTLQSPSWVGSGNHDREIVEELL